MFKGKIIHHSNMNGKVSTFEKEFDNINEYQRFFIDHPEYDSNHLFQRSLKPFNSLREFLKSPFGNTLPLIPLFPMGLLTEDLERNNLPDNVEIKKEYLPEGVDLSKYADRREQKRIESDEKGIEKKEIESAQKKESIQSAIKYLEGYIKENPDDTEAKNDIEKLKSSL